MNTKILAFAGLKQSGKSTCSNFLHGYQLRSNSIIENFAITEEGKLVVKTNILQENGTEVVSDTFLETSRKDLEFVEWAMYNMWPFVKKYSFADTLKEICITLFGLTHEQVYGSEEDKLQLVPHLMWENMPGVMTPENWSILEGRLNPDIISRPEEFQYVVGEGPMTAREFMQYLGTDIMRKIYEPVWVERCLNDIKLEQPAVAIIDDCRFLNEIEAVKSVGGKVLGLNRSVYEDNHSSEKIKEHWDKMDAVINNDKMNIDEMCKAVMSNIEEWGWLDSDISKPEVKNNKKSKLIKS
jgi:hypothetical protein